MIILRIPPLCLGLAQSLFDLLDSPGATLDLNIQYRMNQTLADLANHLTYQVITSLIQLHRTAWGELFGGILMNDGSYSGESAFFCLYLSLCISFRVFPVLYLFCSPVYQLIPTSPN